MPGEKCPKLALSGDFMKFFQDWLADGRRFCCRNGSDKGFICKKGIVSEPHVGPCWAHVQIGSVAKGKARTAMLNFFSPLRLYQDQLGPFLAGLLCLAAI